MSTIVLVSPPRTTTVTTSSSTSVSTVTAVNHNYNEVFNLRPFLLKKNYDANSNFSIITSENFLTRKPSTLLGYLTNSEFNQANTEIQNVAQAFSNALICTNAYVQSTNSGFSSQLMSDLRKWSRISNGNFYPFFTTDTNNAKQSAIRNLSTNLQNLNYNEFEYNVSTAYIGSEGKVKLKGLRGPNYIDSYQDLLNLNLTSLTTYQNALESMGPYYGNGYPDMTMDFSSMPFFLSLGLDVLNLWEMNMLEQFTDMKITTRPFIIQCDSSFAINTTRVTPNTFFNILFGSTLATSDYPATITVNAPSPTATNVDQQQSILDFLTTVPYIVFADTMGYSYVPIGGSASSPLSTVGAIYTCTPYNAVSSSYTFTRADNYIKSSGYLGGATSTTSACYTEYAIAN